MMSRTGKAVPHMILAATLFFTILVCRQAESAEKTVRPVYTVGLSAGAKSWISLGRWVPTNMRWSTFSLDFEYGAEYNERFRVSAKTRVTTYSFPEYVDLWLLDVSLNFSGNVVRLFNSNYLYCSGGIGLGLIDE